MLQAEENLLLNTIFYLEAEKKINLNFLDEEFEIFKEKTMGK